MERECRYVRLVGIAEWLMPRNRQLRSWRVFMESEDNVKKWNGEKENCSSKGAGQGECSVVGGLVCGPGDLSSGPCSAAESPILPFLGLLLVRGVHWIRPEVLKLFFD